MRNSCVISDRKSVSEPRSYLDDIELAAIQMGIWYESRQISERFPGSHVHSCQ